MISKPPVFIALTTKGKIAAHVRADQIEGVYVVFEPDFKNTPMGMMYAAGVRSWVQMISGIKIYTEETIDQVFAKMADALNIEPPTGPE